MIRTTKLHWLQPKQLDTYSAALRTFEQEFTYPLGPDRWFHIDHGTRYSQFFSSMGPCSFVLATDQKDQPIGLLALVEKSVRYGDKQLSALYWADFKVARLWRGRGLGGRMQRFAARQCLFRGKGFRAQSAYFVAMRGQNKDVTQAARGFDPLKFFQPMTFLNIYFADPNALLEAKNLDQLKPGSPGACLNLTPERSSQPMIETRGEKDIIVSPGGSIRRLAHVPGGFDLQQHPHLALQAAARACLAADAAEVCFAVDRTRQEFTATLTQAGIQPTAEAAVYMMSWGHLPISGAWCTIGTYEI